MNYAKNIEKNLNLLKENYEQLTEFKDTYSKTMTEIQDLVKSLFDNNHFPCGSIFTTFKLVIIHPGGTDF